MIVENTSVQLKCWESGRDWKAERHAFTCGRRRTVIAFPAGKRGKQCGAVSKPMGGAQSQHERPCLSPKGRGNFKSGSQTPPLYDEVG